MSQLKDQLQKLLPRLAKEANQLRDEAARKRWMKLRQITMSSKTVRRACSFYGWSEDSFNKWGRRLWKAKSVRGLLSKSCKPYRSPSKTVKRIERKILMLRRVEPSYGPERIVDDLKRLFRITVSTSAVYAVLKRAGVVGQKLSRQLTKRHLKRYRRPLPGYLQMDFKYVPYRINGFQYYQLSCVDHHSSWRLIRCYRRKHRHNVVKFLNELRDLCPFAIIEIQTDNDTAFTDKFSSGYGVTGEHAVDKWCKENNIVHRLIPVGVKELNGKVENTHKQDDREFYAKGPYPSFENLELNTRGYNQRWNTIRRTKTLGFKSPNEVVGASYVRAMAFLLYFAGPEKALYRLDQDANAQLPVRVTKPFLKKNKTRRISLVDRYLKYLEWEKKKFPALILAPPISQNFSVLENLGKSAIFSD